MNYRKAMERKLKRKLTRYEVVHHIDGNRSNNNLSNLRVMSLSSHSSSHLSGRKLTNATKLKLQQKSRDARPKAKLQPDDVLIIRKMSSDGIKQWLIAWIYGIARSTVGNIKNKDSWSWI